MPRTLLPPRGIFTATRVVFDGRLSPGVKETLLQLMALSWASPSHHTPPLSYAQLEAITGKNSRTLRGHLQALRTYQAALRLQPAGAGQFIVALAPWLFSDLNPLSADSAQDGQPFSGRNLPVPVKEEEEFPESGEDFLLLPSHDPDHNGGSFPRDTRGSGRKETSGRKGTPGRIDTSGRGEPSAPAQPRTPSRPAGSKEPSSTEPCPLSKAMQKRLEELGVFPALFYEVARRAAEWKYSERELTALLEWCRDDQPDRPAGLFIGRVRAGARAPALYTAPPCSTCGQRGGHAPDCRARYAVGF